MLTFFWTDTPNQGMPGQNFRVLWFVEGQTLIGALKDPPVAEPVAQY